MVYCSNEQQCVTVNCKVKWQRDEKEEQKKKKTEFHVGILNTIRASYIIIM